MKKTSSFVTELDANSNNEIENQRRAEIEVELKKAELQEKNNLRELLTEAIEDKINLQEMQFNNIKLEDFNWAGATIIGTVFVECNLQNNDFSGVEYIADNMDGVAFMDCNLNKCNFAGCSFISGTISGNKTEETDFSGCYFFDTSIEQIFEKCDFRDATIEEPPFYSDGDIEFKDCNLCGFSIIKD